MGGETVADIDVGKEDGMGLDIFYIYHKVDRIYTIYANSARMAVQYADDQKLASEQRLALSHLAPLRGEINGLIDGWRKVSPLSRANDVKAAARARRYDRRVADALVVALQGDQATASLVLAAIKQDILDERTSLGRLYYVSAAGTLAFGIFILFGIMHSLHVPSFVQDNGIWLATGIGCLGAFFSIAIGVRARTIHTDLRSQDNIVDAGLRILIGAISAVVLFSIFKSEILSVSMFGSRSKFCTSGTECIPDFAVVIGFLAGFSERLVGDLLTNKLTPLVADASVGAAATVAAAADMNRRATASENNPMGKFVGPQQQAATVAKAASAEDEHDEGDYCLCDEDLSDKEFTDDLELPQASGGVEQR